MKNRIEDYIKRIIEKSDVDIYGITVCERGKDVDTFSISISDDWIVKNYQLSTHGNSVLIEKITDEKVTSGLILTSMPTGYSVYTRTRKSHIGGGIVKRINKGFIKLFFNTDIEFSTGGRRFQIEDKDVRFKEKVRQATNVNEIKEIMKAHKSATLPLKVRTLLELIEEKFTKERAETFNRLHIKIQDAIFNISSVSSAKKLLNEAYTIKRLNLWFEAIDFAIKELEARRDRIFDNIMNGQDSPKYPKKLTHINDRLKLIDKLVIVVKQENVNLINS